MCVALVENASEALANLIMNLVRVTDPDTVVLGGGIVSDGYIHEKILEKLTYSYLKNPEHSLLSEALQKTAKDVAGRILQTEYNVRGYELSKPEKREAKKEAKRKSGPIKL